MNVTERDRHDATVTTANLAYGRALDERVRRAVRAGVCRGAAIAAQADALDRHGDDAEAALAALDRTLSTLEVQPSR